MLETDSQSHVGVSANLLPAAKQLGDTREAPVIRGARESSTPDWALLCIIIKNISGWNTIPAMYSPALCAYLIRPCAAWLTCLGFEGDRARERG